MWRQAKGQRCLARGVSHRDDEGLRGVFRLSAPWTTLTLAGEGPTLCLCAHALARRCWAAHRTSSGRSCGAATPRPLHRPPSPPPQQEVRRAPCEDHAPSHLRRLWLRALPPPSRDSTPSACLTLCAYGRPPTSPTLRHPICFWLTSNLAFCCCPLHATQARPAAGPRARATRPSRPLAAGPARAEAPRGRWAGCATRWS